MTESRPRTLADFVAAALEVVEEIAPEQAKRWLDDPDRAGWHFVDVREPDEFAAGRIPGARNVPRGFLEVRADLDHPKRDAWLADRRRPLVLYCGGGNRTLIIERDAPGGQAGMSARIENYLGFPVGLSGGDLARRAVTQARRLGAEMLTTEEVVGVITNENGYAGIKLAAARNSPRTA